MVAARGGDVPPSGSLVTALLVLSIVVVSTVAPRRLRAAVLVSATAHAGIAAGVSMDAARACAPAPGTFTAPARVLSSLVAQVDPRTSTLARDCASAASTSVSTRDTAVALLVLLTQAVVLAAVAGASSRLAAILRGTARRWCRALTSVPVVTGPRPRPVTDAEPRVRGSVQDGDGRVRRRGPPAGVLAAA